MENPPPLLTSSRKLYVFRNAQQEGPYDEEEIKSRLRYGGLSSEDLIWEAGLPDWTPLSNVFKHSYQATQTDFSLADKKLSGYLQELLIVGQRSNNFNLIAGRNLSILNPNNGTEIIRYDETDKPLGVTGAMGAVVAEGKNRRFKVHAIYNNLRVGSLEGHHSCKLLNIENQRVAQIKCKTVFSSVGMLRRYLIPILAYPLLGLFIFLYLKHKIETNDFASINPFALFGMLVTFGLLLPWIAKRNRYFVYDQKDELVFSCARKSEFSKKNFVLFRNNKPVGEFSRLSQKEMCQRLGHTPDQHGDTYNRIVRFSEPVAENEVLFVSMLAYLIFVSCDAES